MLFCKHLFDLSFAEASERNRKLRNSDESPWKEAQIVRCRSSAYPFTSGETAGYHCLEIIEMLNLPVSIDTVWRFLQKAGYRRKKKSLHASEQERPRCGREEEKLERLYVWIQGK